MNHCYPLFYASSISITIALLRALKAWMGWKPMMALVGPAGWWWMTPGDSIGLRQHQLCCLLHQITQMNKVKWWSVSCDVAKMKYGWRPWHKHWECEQFTGYYIMLRVCLGLISSDGHCLPQIRHISHAPRIKSVKSQTICCLPWVLGKMPRIGASTPKQLDG